MNNVRISMLTSAVAALFAVTGCSSSSSDDTAKPTTTGSTTQAAAVKCVGINTCKGTSECQSADGKSACQGQNDCKGQGWVSVPSEKECTDKGGTRLTEKADGGALATKGFSCDGVNACKGQGACKGAGHDCAGKNACKGQGWVEVPSAAACADGGGTPHKA